MNEIHFRAEGNARVKALVQGKAWHIRKIERRLVTGAYNMSEEGKGSTGERGREVDRGRWVTLKKQLSTKYDTQSSEKRISVQANGTGFTEGLKLDSDGDVRVLFIKIKQVFFLG